MSQPRPCLTSAQPLAAQPLAAQRTSDALLLIGARLLVSALVWWSGFRAVSDDDYARVVIAQKFASTPGLDPSGTSWLPFPFWVQGIAMSLLGAELRTAIWVAWASGVAGTLLVWLAARALGLARRSACIAAALASAIAYSAWLGVATVPELLTAGLVLYGAATLAVPDTTQRSWGALALCCATLSRYEAWPVGLVFAAFCARDAHRALRSGSSVGPRPRAKHEARVLAAAALTASAGMLLWLVHGFVNHESATFFVERVAQYQSALGGHDVDPWAALTRHPTFLIAHAPTLVGLAALGAALTRFGLGQSGFGERRPASLARPLLACASLVLFLIAGDLRGAGATHHPARTLLPVWFLACIVVTDTWRAVFMRCMRQRAAWLIHTSLALLALVVVVVDGLHNRVLDGTRGFVDRSNELKVGAHARRLIDDGSHAGAPGRPRDGALGGRVLIAAEDFGYFAMIAAVADPTLVDVFDDRDPRGARQGNLFDRPEVLQRKRKLEHVRVIIIPQSATPPPETLRLLGLQRVATATTKYTLLAVNTQ